MAFSREQLGEMVDTLESTAWTRVGVLPQDPHLEEDVEAEGIAILMAASPSDRPFVRDRVQRLLFGLHRRPHARRGPSARS